MLHRGRADVAMVIFLSVTGLIPLAILFWYDAIGFDLYPGLAAAYRSIGLDMSLIQRNQLNHLIRACIAEPELFWTLVYAAAPALAALVAAAFLAGGDGIRDFLSRYRLMRGAAVDSTISTYSITILVCAGVVVLRLLGCWLMGIPLRIPELGLGYTAVTFAIGLVFNQGGLLEEGGWRGFLQPHLQGLWRRPVVAAVAVGLIWAAWHLPRDLLKGTPFNDPRGYCIEFGEFCLYCVSTSIIHAWLVTTARGTLWPSIAFHGTGNTADWLINQAAAPLSDLQGFLIDNVPALIGAALVVAFWRPSGPLMESIALPRGS